MNTSKCFCLSGLIVGTLLSGDKTVNAETIGFAPSLNIYGTTGLIDLPTADSQPDAEISATIAGFGEYRRGTFTFQILPRLSGSFRYSRIGDYFDDGGTIYDRSFDFRYRVLDEGKIRPNVAIGLRDFLGTGIYSGQYIVATKSVVPSLRVTAGIGWGRLSGQASTQPLNLQLGGQPSVSDWFTGPAGAFGGVEWQTPIRGLRVKAEYSSDEYDRENGDTLTFDRKSSLNFGVDYKNRRGIEFGAYYLYGSEIGFKVTSSLNPRRWGGLNDKAPRAVAVRTRPLDRDTSWTKIDGISDTARDKLNVELNKEGMAVEALVISGDVAELRLRNIRYDAVPQAIGRAARAMAFVFPDSVETFRIVPMEKGIATSAITIQRSDLEAFENHPNGSSLMAQSIDITDAQPLAPGGEFSPDLYPRLTWRIAPFANIVIFDSENPFAITGGIRASAHYDISPGFSLNASVTKKIIKNNSEPSPSASGLPPVRTNSQSFINEGDPAIGNLSAVYLFKLAPAVYGRVSAGYLEREYGGISGEVLWKPAEQKWGLGAELNYVKQRNFDQLLGFQDYEIATGHVSAYVELPRNFEAQIDVGRYLAGDVGATFTVDRTFDNGWSVGAYATLTDADPTDFGEGSFDKGIRVSIPLGWSLGNSTRKSVNMSLVSLVRDGGARVRVRDRLYGVVKDNHASSVSGAWGRFWQ